MLTNGWDWRFFVEGRLDRRAEIPRSALTNSAETIPLSRLTSFSDLLDALFSRAPSLADGTARGQVRGFGNERYLSGVRGAAAGACGQRGCAGSALTERHRLVCRCVLVRDAVSKGWAAATRSAARCQGPSALAPRGKRWRDAPRARSRATRTARERGTRRRRRSRTAGLRNRHARDARPPPPAGNRLRGAGRREPCPLPGTGRGPRSPRRHSCLPPPR